MDEIEEPVVADEPVAEVAPEDGEPVAEEPVVEVEAEPGVEAEPVAELAPEDGEPVAEEPVAEAVSVVDEPVVDGPVDAVEPVVVEPVDAVEPVADEPVDVDEPVADEPVDVCAPRPARRRMSLRRRAAVGAVVLVGALAVSAFARVGPGAGADQHFVDVTRSQGHVVAGGEQQSLLVSAARKICDRRRSHSTVAERHATALSTDELTVVQQIFAGDNRGFTVLALSTYCSS